MSLNKRGFTLIELLVVIAMIAILTASMTSAMSGAQTRARIQKATNDVKVLSQAILAYENYGDNVLTPVGGLGEAGEIVHTGSIGFLLGGQSEGGQQVPALVMAAFRPDGIMYDPWGTPYRMHIRSGSGVVNFKAASSTMMTGFCLPNYYRLGKNERVRSAEDSSSTGGGK